MKWYKEEFRSIDHKVCYPFPQTANKTYFYLSLPFPKWSCRFCPVDLGAQISHPVRETNLSRPYK
jgi:hypothetical protein